jgi:hypothetical protein
VAARGTSSTSGQDAVATLFEGLTSVARFGRTGSRRLLWLEATEELCGLLAGSLVFLGNALDLLSDLFFGHGVATKHVSEKVCEEAS